MRGQAFTQRRGSARPGSGTAGPVEDIFNTEVVGLPQNEESVNAGRADTLIVLGGTNDNRALIDPQGNLTGWHFSTNRGRDLTNEGLLPPVPVGGVERPSGGDPIGSTPRRPGSSGGSA